MRIFLTLIAAILLFFSCQMPEQYTVYLRVDDKIVEYQKVRNGERVSLPDPPDLREGEEFIAWCVDGDAYDFNNTAYTKDFVLYADYRLSYHSVTFDLENHLPSDVDPDRFDINVTTLTEVIRHNERASKPECSVLIDGSHELSYKWMDSKTGKEYDFSSPVSKDLVLYLHLDGYYVENGVYYIYDTNGLSEWAELANSREKIRGELISDLTFPDDGIPNWSPKGEKGSIVELYGAGYTISNLYIEGSGEHVGMFCSVKDSVFEHFMLRNATVKNNSSGKTALIAGNAEGTNFTAIGIRISDVIRTEGVDSASTPFAYSDKPYTNYFTCCYLYDYDLEKLPYSYILYGNAYGCSFNVWITPMPMIPLSPEVCTVYNSRENDLPTWHLLEQPEGIHTSEDTRIQKTGFGDNMRYYFYVLDGTVVSLNMSSHIDALNKGIEESPVIPLYSASYKWRADSSKPPATLYQADDPIFDE